MEGGNGRYLGLPEHFGRRKRDIFTSIVDRIRQKAIGWSTRFLSTAGKETLLKSVLTAIPTYAMTCFKLPGSLIKRIQSALTRFWWDDKDKKKVSWVAWNKITRPKEDGGLGFKDIENYNIALLAKLSWRLIKEPNALVSRLLLSKYCSHSGFLTCKQPSSSSYGWQGILHGRSLILQGMGWLIGDGTQVKVWADPWLSSDHPLRPIGPPPLLSESLMVSDLIEVSSRSWNMSQLRLHLPLFEQQVRAIPLSAKASQDRLVWLSEKRGDYTCKSGYRLLTQLQSVSASMSEEPFNWKKHVWKVKTVPKIRSFLWKALVGALAVGDQLQHRNIGGDFVCKRCGELETINHVLLLCPFAQKVWTLAPLDLRPFSSAPTISMFLQATIRNLLPTGLFLPDLYAWILWQLWVARNSLTFSNITISEEAVLLKALQEAHQWQEAQFLKRRPHLTPSHTSAPVFTTGISCFIDASWDSTTSHCGLGCVFRSHTDEFVDKEFSSSSTNVSSALLAEARAMVFALQQASSLGFQELHVFSDSQVLINLLLSDHSHNDLYAILDDIRMIFNDFASISCHFIPRSSNFLADTIAKRARSLLVPPSFDG